MSADQIVPATFPTLGLDVTCEFGRQPDGTAPDSQNVRSFEQIQDRNRGGSRPGLSKYNTEQHSGTALIQHLSVLVDPQAPALSADPNPTFPDPSSNNLKTRNPGNVVRLGGSANSPGVPSTPGDIAFVRICTGIFHPTSDGPLSFTLPVKPGNQNTQICVFFASGAVDIETSPPGPPALHVSQVSNGLLDNYEQVGGIGYVATSVFSPNSPAEQFFEVSMFYRVVAAGSAEQEVRFQVVNTGPECLVQIIGIEYTNVGAITNAVKASGVNSTLISFPDLELNGTAGQLVISATGQSFFYPPGVEAALPPPGFVQRTDEGNELTWVWEMIASGVGPAQISSPIARTAPWAGIAATFGKRP